MTLPTDAKARKDMPIARGVLDYFPDALAEVANVSRVGNEQHNPGQPMHWAKEKSTDEADCIIRHLVDRGELDTDGLRHSAKVAWRALALLQRELDAEADAKQPAAREPVRNPLDNWVPLNPRIEERLTKIETESRFAHACPDLDQELPPCQCDAEQAAKCYGYQSVENTVTHQRLKCRKRSFDVV